MDMDDDMYDNAADAAYGAACAYEAGRWHDVIRHADTARRYARPNHATDAFFVADANQYARRAFYIIARPGA